MIEIIMLFGIAMMGGDYDESYQTIFSPPTVCTIPPDDPLITPQIKKNYLRETRDGILEWQYMVQSKAKIPTNYKITYLEGVTNNCDVIIEFKRHIDESTISDYYDVLGSYYDGKIELYFQEFSSCGEYGETRCFYEEAIPAREISVTAKHEFGHALGLEHRWNYDTFGNAETIMNEYTNRVNDQNKITEYDVNDVLSIYGDDGFNKKPIWKIENMRYVPVWFKSVVNWWADGKITDDEFQNGIEYMVNRGIIKV